MANPASDKSFLYQILNYLAFFCIGLGIISVISSNWQLISDGIKLTIDLLLLSATAWYVWFAAEHGKQGLKESLILFYSILIMASIGLVAQIYQLQAPHSGGVLLLWALLNIPLLLISRKKILPFFWIPMFWYALFQYYEFSPLSKYMDNQLGFVNVCMLWLSLVLVFYILADSLLKEVLPELLWSYKLWLVLGLVYGISLLDIASIENMSITLTDKSLVFYLLPGGYLLIAAVLYALNLAFKQSTIFSSVFAYMMFYALLLSYGIVADNEFAGFASTVLFLCLWGAYAWRKNNYATVRNLSILLALRIFIGFIQVFGSLLMTGIGLIVSGILTLSLIWIIRNIRQAR